MKAEFFDLGAKAPTPDIENSPVEIHFLAGRMALHGAPKWSFFTIGLRLEAIGLRLEAI
jgi:hypothetical protein